MHGPHEHEVEHRAQSGDFFAGRIAVTLIQVAIALAAIALLTRKKWLQWGVYGMAAGGAVLAGFALLPM